MAGSTKTSLTNDLKREGPSRKGGQKEADGHSGIIKVPRPEQAVKTRTASTTRPTGGQTQLFSPLQSPVPRHHHATTRRSKLGVKTRKLSVIVGSETVIWHQQVGTRRDELANHPCQPTGLKYQPSR